MKGTIQQALDHATALYDELVSAREALGRYEGKQLDEAGTERQLDRWTMERGAGEAMDAAVRHMAKVLEEVRRVQAELDS